MELRSNLIAKKSAVRNCERMVLGLPYRPLNNLKLKMKLFKNDEDIPKDDDVILSRGEEDDVFVDEDSNMLSN